MEASIFCEQFQITQNQERFLVIKTPLITGADCSWRLMVSLPSPRNVAILTETHSAALKFLWIPETGTRFAHNSHFRKNVDLFQVLC